MKTSPYFEFQSKVRIFAGSNSLEKIGEDMEIRGVSRPMILSSRTVARSGLLGFIEKGYRPGMETGVTDTDIPADSDLETVRYSGVSSSTSNEESTSGSSADFGSKEIRSPV